MSDINVILQVDGKFYIAAIPKPEGTTFDGVRWFMTNSTGTPISAAMKKDQFHEVQDHQGLLAETMRQVVDVITRGPKGAG